MQYPETIIELDAYFSEDDKKMFFKLMKKHFDIEEKDINIYKANDYAKDSDFSSEIYERVFRILESENWLFCRKIRIVSRFINLHNN